MSTRSDRRRATIADVVVARERIAASRKRQWQVARCELLQLPTGRPDRSPVGGRPGLGVGVGELGADPREFG
ncbi:MAG: hypothetical protein L0H84_21170, partial [Pseudonocardia sp.]|nr:hypothetical protein [Pseudonocardia sp.]